jgi:eukaryotic-like serine/threonine-protein kinase
VASSLNNLASVRLEQNELDEAERLLERARSIWEVALGPTHPRVAHAHLLLGEVALKRGRAAQAVLSLERAVEIRTHAQVPASELARAQLALAEALWRVGTERPRARELARAAAALQAGSEPSSDAKISATAWLAAHGDP